MLLTASLSTGCSTLIASAVSTTTSARLPIRRTDGQNMLATTLGSSSLALFRDDRFDDEIFKSPQDLVIDFFADFCGPCKICEPALVQLDESDVDVRVLKAKLDQNPELHAWLMRHGIKVSMLPTLVLIRGGRPVRTLKGARNILDEKSLHEFATSESDHVDSPAAPPEAILGQETLSKMRSFFSNLRRV